MALIDKLKAIKSTESTAPIDWNNRKEQWISQVNNLYQQTREWLKDYESDRFLEFRSETKALLEEHIGPYQITTLKIIVGSHIIVFDPVGTLVIGGHGRIDVFRSGYYKKRFMLILTGFEDEASRWLRVPSDSRTNQRQWTQEALEETLELLLSED